MKSRVRVMASIQKKEFDRLPIKHLAVKEIDIRLIEYFGLKCRDELLDVLGDDFREISAIYRGPQMEGIEAEHGITANRVWRAGISSQIDKKEYPLADLDSAEQLENLPAPQNDWFDYSNIRAECEKYKDYARIFGYCEMDFINQMGILRGEEQTLVDMALKEPVFIELVERKYKFACEHIKRALEAGGGLIDFVHFADDLGSQGDLIISPGTFRELFAEKYKDIFQIVHNYGARTMMHSCGSVKKIIPDLIEIGLDVLDVVQTNAADMDLDGLKKEFGVELAFAGTMCVQKVLPFGSLGDIREEVRKRIELFSDGGLIIGPSHQIQTDTPLENILEMYRAAGGLKERNL